MKIISTLRGVMKDRKGITALEYGLIGALIVVGIVAAMTTIGTKLATTFGNIANSL
jgi:pilus assembly protein Flp/PilA